MLQMPIFPLTFWKYIYFFIQSKYLKTRTSHFMELLLNPLIDYVKHKLCCQEFPKMKTRTNKLVKQNCSKMMNDDSYEGTIYNRKLFMKQAMEKIMVSKNMRLISRNRCYCTTPMHSFSCKDADPKSSYPTFFSIEDRNPCFYVRAFKFLNFNL